MNKTVRVLEWNIGIKYQYLPFLHFTEITLFDERGNKTSVPNKERQIEALQLLFMLLPPANRSLLKLLLDLLYQTAKQQDKNKMSAFNLALMFAPHIIWPKNVGLSPSQPLFSCVVAFFFIQSLFVHRWLQMICKTTWISWTTASRFLSSTRRSCFG